MSKGTTVAESFYPFVDNPGSSGSYEGGTLEVRHAARIAVFDDEAAAPRVVVIDPTDIRSYLEEITATVTRLAQEQGGKIPFTVIREVVENLIHAYFIEPTVSILDGGNTIRFSDQGPGIADKDRALEFGTTSATAEMKRYIRGVGSGLPYAQQWLEDKGGSLTVEDNIHSGTVVTVSLAKSTKHEVEELSFPSAPASFPQQPYAPQPYGQQGYPPQQPWQQPQPQMMGYPNNPQPWQQGYAGTTYGQPAWPQQGNYAPAQGWPQQGSAGAWMPQGSPTPMTPMPTMPQVSERGMFALEYLRAHESVGPRDLNALQPLSESTWSRVLAQLEDQGFVSKQGGQKRHLTAMGRQFLGM